MDKIKNFEQFISEQFVIGSEPLEASMELREKLEKIITELSEFEKAVIAEMDDNTLEDYSSDIQEITGMLSRFNRNEIQNLEITLGDFNYNFKNKKGA